MLKEGWGVKNVYVICSLRASVSAILTEQTLGRGLRLPFGGRPTRNEMLDTLEVVGHERFDALIHRIDRMREEFVDYRTVLEAAQVKQEAAALPIAAGEAGAAVPGAATITNTDERIGHTEDLVAGMTGPELHPRRLRSLNCAARASLQRETGSGRIPAGYVLAYDRGGRARPFRPGPSCITLKRPGRTRDRWFESFGPVAQRGLHTQAVVAYRADSRNESAPPRRTVEALLARGTAHPTVGALSRMAGRFTPGSSPRPWVLS
jgi:hypothetical protein